MSNELVSRIRGVRFKPVRFREGYDMRVVDDFLDRLVEAASEGRPLRGLVDSAGYPSGFRTVKWREGYDKGEVDTFLAGC